MHLWEDTYIYIYIYINLLSHLADAFIQSDLQIKKVTKIKTINIIVIIYIYIYKKYYIIYYNGAEDPP